MSACISSLAHIPNQLSVEYEVRTRQPCAHVQEMLFGLKTGLNVHHVDVWAAGCVLAELMMGQPLFPGENEMAVLSKICAILGSPNESNWPGCTELPCYLAFRTGSGTGLYAALQGMGPLRSPPVVAGMDPSPLCMGLLTKLLALDPADRISPDQALASDFFKRMPEPLMYHPAASPAPAPPRNISATPQPDLFGLHLATNGGARVPALDHMPLTGAKVPGAETTRRKLFAM